MAEIADPAMADSAADVATTRDRIAPAARVVSVRRAAATIAHGAMKKDGAELDMAAADSASTAVAAQPAIVAVLAANGSWELASEWGAIEVSPTDSASET